MFETTNYIDTNIADILYVTGFVGNKISAGNNLKPDFPSLAPPRNVVLRAWIVLKNSYLSKKSKKNDWTSVGICKNRQKSAKNQSFKPSVSQSLTNFGDITGTSIFIYSD